MLTSSRASWLPVNYAAATFVSAFLLFQIQPLVTKHILPWFGGSPAVWTTSLLFFQSLLFAGYAYAHFNHRRLRPRKQALVHVALVAAAAAFALLHLLPDERWEPRGQVEPVGRILIVLALSVGLPYFVLAGTAPLLQAWFVRAFPGRVPYRLYALSNVGSLLALVSYPFFFEPMFDVPRQARIWSAGFLLFASLIGYSAWRLWTKREAEASADRKPVPPKRMPTPAAAGSSPSWLQRLLWLAWPAFGSVVLLATTNHITTDIAAMPFLWVVPLALYLLTFIIAFDRPRWYRRTLVAVFVLLAIYGTVLVHSEGVGSADLYKAGTPGLVYSHFAGPAEESPTFYISVLGFLVVNLAAMFAICMLCHGELVRQRPDPRYLTSFYLMIALGGALGGAFVTLAAPQLFSTYYEWQLSLIIACVFAIGFLLRALVDFAFGDDDEPPRLSRYAQLGAVVLAVFLPSAVMLLDLSEFLQPPTAKVQLRTRNFFGTLAVLERHRDKPLRHDFFLKHGTITHGAQFTHASRRREPTTYYARTSGVARTIDFYRRELKPNRTKLGVVGLGTGTLAAFADGGDSITFYEINPAVVEIAEGGRWFTFLADCRQRGAQCEIRLGDARLTLRRELASASPPRRGEGLGEGHAPNRGQQYHVLALDAFSGDSIPVHLLTVDAFELYLSHLAAPGALPSGEVAAATGSIESGAIAVHISNRYVDLSPIIRSVAKHFGLHALHIENEDDPKQGTYSADWMILTRNQALADELTHFAVVPDPAAPTILWTDTRSSLFDILK